MSKIGALLLVLLPQMLLQIEKKTHIIVNNVNTIHSIATLKNLKNVFKQKGAKCF